MVDGKQVVQSCLVGGIPDVVSFTSQEALGLVQPFAVPASFCAAHFSSRWL